MQPVFGIDFGTTNSALSVYRNGTVEVVAVDDGTVFLTGGTSRIPYIQALFAERFGRDKLENRGVFTSVVHGLGASVPLYV